jgi:putative flippase GtrA
LSPGSPLTQLINKFGRFLLVGGLCTAIQYALLVLLTEFANFTPTVASTVGYLCSSLVNYLLSYSFTFGSAARHRQSLPRFVLIMTVGVGLNAAVTFVGSTVWGLHYLIAQAMATCITLLWNFWANLRWTFNSSREQP